MWSPNIRDGKDDTIVIYTKENRIRRWMKCRKEKSWRVGPYIIFMRTASLT
jgi:hypothetical protein